MLRESLSTDKHGDENNVTMKTLVGWADGVHGSWAGLLKHPSAARDSLAAVDYRTILLAPATRELTAGNLCR